jgi:hypothetical protein
MPSINSLILIVIGVTTLLAHNNVQAISVIDTTTTTNKHLRITTNEKTQQDKDDNRDLLAIGGGGGDGGGGSDSVCNEYATLLSCQNHGCRWSNGHCVNRSPTKHPTTRKPTRKPTKVGECSQNKCVEVLYISQCINGHYLTAQICGGDHYCEPKAAGGPKCVCPSWPNCPT